MISPQRTLPIAFSIRHQIELIPRVRLLAFNSQPYLGDLYFRLLVMGNQTRHPVVLALR